MAIINETITKFSFVGSLKPQENFNKNLNKSIGLLAGFVAGIGAATGVMYRWTNGIAQAIDPTIQLSRETGEAVETIQALGYAASQNGSDLNAVESSISNLNKRMGEFVRTGGGSASEVAIQLGLNLRKSNGEVKQASEVMLELNDKLSRFSRAEQSDILEKLGIDSSLIQTLNLSSDAITDLTDKAYALGVVNKEQADLLASYNDANTTLRFGLKSLQNQIAIGLAPVLKNLIKGFTDWLATNKDLIRDLATRFGNAILSVTAFIGRMKYVILGAAAAFGVFKIASLGLGKALALAFSPVTLIIAGITAAILVIDDLIVAFNGGKSVIRDLIQEWTGFDITPALQAGVKAIKEFASYLLGIGKEIVGGLGSVFSGIWKIWNGDFEDGFSDILGGFNRLADSLVSIFSGAFKWIAEQISAIIPDWVKDAYKATSGAAKGALGAASNAVDSVSSAASSAIDWGRSLFGGSSTSNNTSNATVTQSNDIKIYTSDPTAAGQAVADFSSKQLKDTKDYYSRGGF